MIAHPGGNARRDVDTRGRRSSLTGGAPERASRWNVAKLAGPEPVLREGPQCNKAARGQCPQPCRQHPSPKIVDDIVIGGLGCRGALGIRSAPSLFQPVVTNQLKCLTNTPKSPPKCASACHSRSVVDQVAGQLEMEIGWGGGVSLGVLATSILQRGRDQKECGDSRTSMTCRPA